MNFENIFRISLLLVFGIYSIIRGGYSIKIQKSGGKVYSLGKDSIENEGMLRVILRPILFSTRIIAVIMYVAAFKHIAFAQVYIPIFIRIVGIILGVIDIPFILWIQRSLGKFWSTSLRIRDNHELIKIGPYEFIRHPMYTSLIIFMLSVSFISANLFVIVPSAVAIISIYTRIDKEEKMMIKEFNNDYVKYMNETGRLLPKLKY